MMDESRAVLGAWNTCWGSRTNALPNELLMILMTMTMMVLMILIMLLLLILCQINPHDDHGTTGPRTVGQMDRAQFADDANADDDCDNYADDYQGL